MISHARLAAAITTAFIADMARSRALREAVDLKKLSNRGLANLAIRDIHRHVHRTRGPVLFPNLRAVIATQEEIRKRALRGGLGQWEAIFNSVIPALAKAAGSYATARTTGKTAVDLQKLKIQEAELGAKAQEFAAIRERLALARQSAAPGAADAAAASVPGAARERGVGISPWAIGAGVLVLGGGIYLATR